MHQLWSADELREHWVLAGEELALLKGMSERRRLVFCYYLKYFQLHAQFPRTIDYVSEEVSDFLATQIGTEVVRLPDVPDRTDRYYRHQVIEFLNIGRFDGKAQTAFLEWLTCEVLPTAPNPLSLDAMITKWFLAHRIARLKAKRIAR